MPRRSLSIGLAFAALAAAMPAFAASATPGNGDPGPQPPAAEAREARPRLFEPHATWDDGVAYELGLGIQPPEPFRLFPNGTIVSGRLGARLHLDSAAFVTTGDIAEPEPQIDVRRGFVNTEGNVGFRWPLHYRVELGLVDHDRFYVEHAWLELRPRWRDLTVRIGQFEAPLGLDRVTSSNATTFLERAQPVRSLAPGTKAGIQLSRAGADRTVAWRIGYLTDSRRADDAERARSRTRVVGRLTWVPPAFDDPGRDQIVHLGVGVEYVLSSSQSVRYTTTAESVFAPTVVDTGDLDASHSGVHGLELAVRKGPLLVQGEYLGALVGVNGESPQMFWGGYVQLGTMLTGEVRPYERRRGAFGMPTPSAPLSLRARRWGAWEAALRYSYLDLDAGGIPGGRDHAVSLGLNWYWSRHVRLMFDYGFTAVTGSKPDATVHVFQTRLQLTY